MPRPSRVLLVAAVLASLTFGAAAEDQPWRFVVCGDTRGTSSSDQINTPILTEIAHSITNHHPAFVLVPGDLVYSGTLAAFQNWTNIMGPVYRAGIGVYPVLGNHDLASLSGWTTVFGPSIPDNGPAGEINRTYLIVHSNALILNLDEYVTSRRVNQTWINAVLSTNTLPHVFAQGHLPAFKANHTDCLDDYLANRNAFWTSLSNAHCRVYYAGHDHFYNHARIDDGDGNAGNDLHQMIVGTGGAPLYTSYIYNGDNAPFMPQLVYHQQQYGYLVVDVAGYNVTNTWYHRTAANIYTATADVFAYTVPDLRPVMTVSRGGEGIVLTWSNGGTLQSAGVLSGPFTNITGAVSPFVVTNLPGSARFYRVRLP